MRIMFQIQKSVSQHQRHSFEILTLIRIHTRNCDFSCGKWQEELRVDRSSWNDAKACEAKVRRDGLTCRMDNFHIRTAYLDIIKVLFIHQLMH